MTGTLTTLFYSISELRVLLCLLQNEQRRSLREIADLADLSVMGTRDILKRLEALGIVHSEREGNRTIFGLTLSVSERQTLRQLSSDLTTHRLRARAEELSKRSTMAVGWIDETLTVFQGSKAKRD